MSRNFEAPASNGNQFASTRHVPDSEIVHSTGYALLSALSHKRRIMEGDSHEAPIGWFNLMDRTGVCDVYMPLFAMASDSFSETIVSFRSDILIV